MRSRPTDVWRDWLPGERRQQVHGRCSVAGCVTASVKVRVRTYTDPDRERRWAYCAEHAVAEAPRVLAVREG